MNCYAYCTAKSYDIKQLLEHMNGRFTTSRFREILHVEIPKDDHHADVFFFPYGAIVAWGLSETEGQQLLKEIDSLESNQKEEGSEFDEFTYEIDEKNKIENDHISLTNNTTLMKLAFSHPIAQSVKLGTFEQMSHAAFKETKHLPESLAHKGTIPLSRRQIRKKIGQLFLDRSSINLHLDVLDTPEFYWEHPEFESIYMMMANELDLESRTTALNQQLDFIHEMFDMLNTELNHQHSSRLEWAIILLIIIEVILFSLHDILELI